MMTPLGLEHSGPGRARSRGDSHWDPARLRLSLPIRTRAERRNHSHRTGEGAPTVFTQDAPLGSLVVNSLVGSNTEPLSFYAIPIESSASGQISISITGTEVRGYGVSGLLIQGAVPEPTSFTLAGIGMAGVVIYGWRKRRRG
jgi:hypothetical protein